MNDIDIYCNQANYNKIPSSWSMTIPLITYWWTSIYQWYRTRVNLSTHLSWQWNIQRISRCNLIGYITETKRNVNAYNRNSTGSTYVNGHSCVFACFHSLNQIEFRKTILLIPIALAYVSTTCYTSPITYYTYMHCILTDPLRVSLCCTSVLTSFWN